MATPMSKAFLTDEAKEALTGAIRAIEARSCAEVVIAVRAKSAAYLHADLISGILAGLATLAYTLWSAHGFSLVSILLDPIGVGVLFGLLTSQLPYTRRWFTPTGIRQRWVRRAAKAVFYEKGIRATSQRIGILVYISLLERHATVVTDSSIDDAVDADAWTKGVGVIDRAVDQGVDGVAVAALIEQLGDILEPCLPVSEDDVNELPDEVSG